MHAGDQEHGSTNLNTAWLEGIWFGRDSKTNEHLIETPNDMVRYSTLKRRVERQRRDINFLNVMRTPIPFPKAHITSPNAQETTLGTTTTYSAERTRVRLSETEAEGAPPVQKTRTTSSAETTSQTRTTSSARALIEHICLEVDQDCESPTQIRRIAAAEYEKFIAKARRIHLEKLTKVKDDAIAKVLSRTDADIRSRMNRWSGRMARSAGNHKNGSRYCVVQY